MITELQNRAGRFLLSPNAGLLRIAVLVSLLVLSTYWIFIDTYRINAFNIVPHDDYAPFLLHLLGEDGGRLPGAPFVFRIFSVAVAAPLYYVLPYFEFSRLENPNVTYLRAVEALAMASYLSMLLSCWVIFRISRYRLELGVAASSIATIGALLLFQYSGYKGVDPVGILLVCLLIYFATFNVVFGALALLSIGFNEKISLILAIVYAARLLAYRDRDSFMKLCMVGGAFAIYLAVRIGFSVPGNEQQLQPGGFLALAAENLLALGSLKNFVLIVLPLVTLTALFGLANLEVRAASKEYRPILFTR